jgi:hypothetical protein
MSAIPGQLINKEVPVNFEGLRMGDVAKKKLSVSPFNEDLSDEVTFSQIHLDG